MTQRFFPPSSESKHQQIYCYVNNLTKIVIAKVHGLKNRHCERVIFPQEKFLFIANDNCESEVSQQTNIGIIKDNIACYKLKILNNISQNLAEVNQ